MTEFDGPTEVLIAFSILGWMFGLYIFDTIRRRRRERREMWKRESETRWG